MGRWVTANRVGGGQCDSRHGGLDGDSRQGGLDGDSRQDGLHVMIWGPEFNSPATHDSRQGGWHGRSTGASKQNGLHDNSQKMGCMTTTKQHAAN
jgi:hypothetical protein